MKGKTVLHFSSFFLHWPCLDTIDTIDTVHTWALSYGLTLPDTSVGVSGRVSINTGVGVSRVSGGGVRICIWCRRVEPGLNLGHSGNWLLGRKSNPPAY